ncbi:MAG: Ig-like domain-containing protein [Bacteroidota bacterium]
MNISIISRVLCLLAVVVLFSNCKRDRSDDAVLATFPKNGEVYIDGFSAGLEYLPFGDSYFEAFSVDDQTFYEGTSAMRFDVPNVGNPDGAYAGAIFPDNGKRDLSDFDALVFWAKGTRPGVINEIGFGQDFGENKFQVTLAGGLQLTTNWKQYVIAIPDPSKLIAEAGLFWYAEGPEDGEGYTFWVDELEFKTLGNIGQPRPSILGGADVTLETFVGVDNPISSLQQTFNLGDGSEQTLNVAPAYFEFTSSDPNVVTVDENGVTTAVAEGTAVITASLNDVEAAGELTITVLGNFNFAPEPTQDPGDVISIFSDAYTNIPVDYYNGFWAPFQTTLGGANTNIAGDNLISYTELNFVGIQFADNVPTVDATAMSHFHMDVLPREDISGGDFLTVRLVDAGPDNTLGTGDDSSGETTITDANLTNGDWYSLDIPLTDMAGLTSRSNLAQVVFVTDATVTSVFLDNIYLYSSGGGGGMGPAGPAPTPTQDPGDVISLYSDAYTDVPGSDINPDWGQATMTSEIQIAGNNTLFYGGLNYQGFQIGTPQDVSGMDFVHIDFWTDNSTTLNFFLISGDATETPVSLTVPTSGWTSIDIPLSSFAPVDLTDVIQYKIDGNGDIYFDNVYFYTSGGGGGMGPATPAPTPTQDPGNVISLYSDTYTNVPGSDINPDWGQATVTSEIQISGNNTLSYQGLNYQGFQIGTPQDVSGMEFVHIDFWTDNSTALNFFLISGDAAETPVALTVPTSGWTSIDIPLSSFSPVDLTDIIQYKVDGNGDIYLDNIYFYTTGGGGMGPATPAPTPTQDPGNVISLYSDTYMNVPGSDINPDWGQATVTSEIQISGNNTLSYQGLNYQGFQIGTPQDVSGMEFVHIDFWTDNSTALNFFLISGDAAETPVSLTVPTAGWTSIDIPLSSFSPVDLTDIIQYKVDGNGDIYLDNIYFYTTGGGGMGPATPAPTPTQDPGDVISLYSDAYMNVPGSDINPDWGQATVTSEIQISGNNTLSYQGLNYQGFQIGTPQDVSGMDFVHIDFWTDNSTALNFFLISGDAAETPVALTVPTSGWTSLDIPLSSFAPVDLTDIIQYKVDGNGDIYLDNIYFYTNGGGGMEPELPLDFEDGVNPMIAFDNGATAAVIDNSIGGTNTSNKILEFNKVVGSEWYSGVVFDETLRATPLIDLANGTVFTVKIWSPNAGVIVRMQLEGGAAPAYEVFQTINTANEWVTLTFDFTSQVNASDTYPRFALFPDFDTGNQVPVAVGAIYYIDDIVQQ